MKPKLKIPHDGYVLVGDGRKALFLKNQGDELYPNLQLDQMIEAPENPQAHLQGTDRPGRLAADTQRSAVEQTDWHDLAEQRFAKEMASKLQEICGARDVPSVVIVAPPHTLAALRDSLPGSVRQIVIAEVNKDLTKIPIYEIERHLTAT